MTQAIKPQTIPRTSRAEVAGYAADMLASLRRLSEANGMPFLAHLTDLARIEAVRNSKLD
jgi:3-deoxy-D-arabino-heptulosonate 7-phosphate (DAHP) synthase